MVGLTEACEIFSLPLDDRENLDHWVMLLDELEGQENDLLVAPAPGLRERLRAVLPGAGWPRTTRVPMREPESIKDDWEFAFWRDTQVDAELLADEAIETRFIERVLAHLAGVLNTEEQRDLIAWANAEDVARQGEPRPAIWPPKKPLALEPAR